MIRLPLSVLVLVAALTAPAQAAPASSVDCSAPGHLDCVEISSPRAPGKRLTMDDFSDPHSYLRLKTKGGPNGIWRMLVEDRKTVVRVKNVVSRRCVDVWGLNAYLVQWECEGQSGQRWHLVPYSLSANTYRIRHDDTGTCFTRDSSDWVYVARCSSVNPQQEWLIGLGGETPQAIRDLAVRYALRFCDTNPESCRWEEDVSKKAPAFLGAAECVSQLVHNSSHNPATYTRTWEQTVGWENTVGGSVKAGVEVGLDLGVEAKVELEVEANYAHTWIGSESVTDAVTITLKQGEYGWVTRRPLLKRVTGTWTFDIGGQQWSIPAVIKLPARDGTDRKRSVLDIRTSTAVPTGCG